MLCAYDEICINLLSSAREIREYGMDSQAAPEIAIDLNSESLFTLADSGRIEKQLQQQIDLRVKSQVFAAVTVDGGIPPDVFIQVVQSALPLSQIVINIVSSALYDLLKAAPQKEEEGVSQGIFETWATDSNGEPTARARVETNDPEVIKDLFRQINEAASDSHDAE